VSQEYSVERSGACLLGERQDSSSRPSLDFLRPENSAKELVYSFGKLQGNGKLERPRRHEIGVLGKRDHVGAAELDLVAIDGAAVQNHLAERQIPPM
jgi:hypothetical protein